LVSFGFIWTKRCLSGVEGPVEWFQVVSGCFRLFQVVSYCFILFHIVEESSEFDELSESGFTGLKDF
jgi:hypothetical protein